jgi:hypothetical protein
MNKEQLLNEIKNKISTGEITRDEIINSLKTETTIPQNKPSIFSLTKIFYALGAVIVIIGLITFVSQIWNDIQSFGRILVTFGLGFLMTGIGAMLIKNKPEDKIGTVFYFIGGILVPSGALVTLYELSTGGYHSWIVAGTFGSLFAFYLLLNWINKNSILAFFAIANGTAFVYLLVNAIISNPYDMWFNSGDIYQYLTVVIGMSYLQLGRFFEGKWNSFLIGVIYFVGITGLLGSAFSLIFDSGIYQLIYFVILIACFFLSVSLKNRIILIMSTIFLITFLSYITSEYFANSVGWPVSLVFLGFLFIGLGYISININKNYISK